MNDDMALVRDYATNRSEAAFATLVSRHLDLVYGEEKGDTADASFRRRVTSRRLPRRT